MDTKSAPEPTSGGESGRTETTSTAAPTGTGAWRQSQFDDGNSGYAPDNIGPTRAAETHWQFTWSALGGVEAPPAVAGDTVYVGTRDDKLYALREQ